MEIELETTASPGRGRMWLDVDGFSGPFKPGDGPRRDPRGEFPTGPAVGATLPDIDALDQNGRLLNVHEHRDGKPAAVVFFRSAVW